MAVEIRIREHHLILHIICPELQFCDYNAAEDCLECSVTPLFGIESYLSIEYAGNLQLLDARPRAQEAILWHSSCCTGPAC